MSGLIDKHRKGIDKGVGHIYISLRRLSEDGEDICSFLAATILQRPNIHHVPDSCDGVLIRRDLLDCLHQQRGE